MEYKVKKVKTVDWEEIPRVELTHTGWLKEVPISAWAQLCHDGEHLYVRMEAAEFDIRATLTGLLDQVCNDSCLEFFFAPDGEDHRYFNFELNPLGTLYLGFGGPRATRVRQIVKKPEELFAPKPFPTESGWGIEYRVPAEFIARYFPGYTLSGKAACNFYKCGDDTAHPHYLSWNPMTSPTPDYHRREDFGTLIFE